MVVEYLLTSIELLLNAHNCAGIHRHFVLYGLMEYLRRRSFISCSCSFDRNFSAEEVLQLLDRFYNLELLKPDDEEAEIFREDDFSLPQSFFIKDEQ
ncbi:hypothetical protein BHM03_00057927 [Ensete ventricosum]|nr:hypothetical protein BHM03_00057927 [Ensete ventricosum]